MAEPPRKVRRTSESLVAAKLGPSFGKDGDFTVAVEESAEGSDAKGSRTEFKVWSQLLSAWSEVFNVMITKDFVESSKKEVIIKDFSSTAVENFLRFLYSGVIADKYQVLELRDLCLKMVEDALGEDVKNAWVIFQSADRLQLKGFRKKSKDKILIEAKAAFESRPLVKQELLDEVLGSNLFCITDQELFDLLSKWTDAQGQISSKTLIGKWVSMDKVSVAEQNFKVDDCNETKSMRKRGEHTNDLLCGVKDRFIRDVASKIVHSEAGRMLFLTDWVCAVFGWRDVTKFHDSIYGLANGEQSVTLLKDLWIEWRLPKFAAHLIAIKFTQEFTKDDHLEIFCAADCSGWQRVFSSKDHDCLIAKDAVVPCECEGMVQRFRIQIVSGQYPIKCVKFEVILRQISYLEI